MFVVLSNIKYEGLIQHWNTVAVLKQHLILNQIFGKVSKHIAANLRKVQTQQDWNLEATPQIQWVPIKVEMKWVGWLVGWLVGLFRRLQCEDRATHGDFILSERRCVIFSEDEYIQ